MPADSRFNASELLPLRTVAVTQCQRIDACAAFFEAEKEEVNFHLGRLCKQLRLTRAMQKMHHIRKARVPIVKVPFSHHVKHRHVA